MSGANGSGQSEYMLAQSMDTEGRASSRPDGAPARNYLNENVVPHLLEGVRMLAINQWV
ncbi:hypothetical protein KEM54_003953 [Ascosphaera aggregata]|nr:hypothetical protein KEM54_003953 [Ascosphaera aggregata]